jgi:hypothetical protein
MSKKQKCQTCLCEVGIRVKNFCAAVPPGQDLLSQGALENHLGAVGSQGSQQLLFGAPRDEPSGSVRGLGEDGPGVDFRNQFRPYAIFGHDQGWSDFMFFINTI